MATRLSSQATAVQGVLRPVAREHLRPAAKHYLGLAPHSLVRDFHQAIRPEQVAREDLQRAGKDSLGLARHSLGRNSPQAILPERVAAARLPPRQARLYRCSPSRVRASLSRSKPVGRKCSRAARYADHPTLDAGLELPIAEDRHRQRRNRREFVGCGSKNNRSRRKRVCRARPFQILASGKCRYPLRRFAVRDVQSVNRECRRARARKKRASPGARERVE